jgi:hypothetical protein
MIAEEALTDPYTPTDEPDARLPDELDLIPGAFELALEGGGFSAAGQDPFEHGPAPERPDAPTLVPGTLDLPDEEVVPPVDEDGERITREDEMVEPADTEDLEYSGTDPDGSDSDDDPVPLA